MKRITKTLAVFLTAVIMVSAFAIAPQAASEYAPKEVVRIFNECVEKTSYAGDIDVNYDAMVDNIGTVQTGKWTYNLFGTAEKNNKFGEQEIIADVCGMLTQTDFYAVATACDLEYDAQGNMVFTLFADTKEVLDSIDVNIEFTFGQWLLYIICFGWIWM